MHPKLGVHSIIFTQDLLDTTGFAETLMRADVTGTGLTPPEESEEPWAGSRSSPAFLEGTDSHSLPRRGQNWSERTYLPPYRPTAETLGPGRLSHASSGEGLRGREGRGENTALSSRSSGPGRSGHWLHEPLRDPVRTSGPRVRHCLSSPPPARLRGFQDPAVLKGCEGSPK